MEKHAFCILFCTITWFSASSQQLIPNWYTIITTSSTNVLSSNIHSVGSRVIASLTDEDDLQSFLQVLNPQGGLSGQISIPTIEYVTASYYSNVDTAFYLIGSNATADSMIFSKMTLSGVTLWRKALIEANYSVNAPYDISEREGEVLFSYSLFDFSGPSISSAIGYYVFDRQGNLIRQSQPFEFQSASVPIISYATALDQEGNVILAVTNFLGPCSIIKFDKTSALPIWQQDFNLENNDIQTLEIDAENNIFFSGYDNILTKLDPNGSIIFEKNLGLEGFHGAQKILFWGGFLYTLGYHYPENVDKSQIFIGQFNPETGDRNWGWYLDSIPNPFGLGIEDGVFADDSTLYILGSATAEFEFVMKLKLVGTVSTYEYYESEEVITIFPNPTSSNRVILSTAGMQGIITLSTDTGQVILQQQVNDGDELILPSSGIYLLRFQNEKSEEVKKIISTHR
jgi:hypothetical protein